MAIVLFVGYVFWGSNMAGDQAAAQVLQRASSQLDRPQTVGPSPVVSQPGQTPTTESVAEATTSVPAEGDVLGVVSIPSLDVEVPVLEGMDADVLDQGVLGHYPGTASPGSVGNFAIAGHRTTHGAPLYDIDRITVGDPVVVQTAEGWDVYTMQRRRIVDPEAVEVIAAVPDRPGLVPTQRWMVLTSCHPKVSAAQRMIVYASFDRHVSRDQGPPKELD